MDHAIVSHNIGDDHIGDRAGAVANRDTSRGRGDAQPAIRQNRPEIVRPRREIAGHQLAVIDVIQQHINQLLFVFRQ